MFLALVALAAQVTLTPYAKVSFKPIDELSGMVASRSHKDTYWVHNDSGDAPRFFAIRHDGSIILPKGKTEDTFKGIQVAEARNQDWEDIAYDGRHIYLCDTGNNNNARQDLTVYVLNEPDPTKADIATPVDTWKIRYPDQIAFPPAERWTFDCEATYWRDGKLYFLTKHRTGNVGIPESTTSLYVLDNPNSRVENTLRKLATDIALDGWVTAADISPDGKRLAVLTHSPSSSVWLFDATKPVPVKHLLGRYRFKGARQCESIAWDGNEKLIIGNEQRDLFEVQAADIKPQ